MTGAQERELAVMVGEIADGFVETVTDELAAQAVVALRETVAEHALDGDSPDTLREGTLRVANVILLSVIERLTQSRARILTYVDAALRVEQALKGDD